MGVLRRVRVDDFGPQGPRRLLDHVDGGPPLGDGAVLEAAPEQLGAEDGHRVLLLLDALGIHRPTVVGHSFGADVALYFALNFPERIARVIARQTEQEVQKVLTDMERDFWMNAEEAIKYGLVSRVIETSRDLA